ncbi:proton-coupled amino acid transporter-like protein pathetic [Microplitis mediator]|uniref:proton-coupled amino acid transporter-like protein pathetic n=1 Tax=Microplitis mediator TaxID=375433 RepID=UPI002554F2FF|nr:proton-coupled amino acid transporter-like protein pathetic [Microplitis mediator]XP_057333764.1 proton-coupled amino acid transporter-like protein pathetic [Microplitis mediator]
MVERNNKSPTEMHTFLPHDEALASKYKVHVVSKDADGALPLSDGRKFDPFTERKIDNPTTDCDTLTHLLKAALGTGILSMPYAFKSSGLVGGIFGTILASLICTHCSYILVKCAHVLYHKTHKTKMGFADVAETAFANGPKWGRPFAKFSRYFVQICLFSTYFGACTAYNLIIATNFGQVINYYMYYNETAVIASNLTSANVTDVVNATSSAVHVVPLDTSFVRVIIACLFVPLILLVYVPDLKYLAPVSMVANIFMACSLGITFYYLVQDTPPVSDLPLFQSFMQFPQFFSVTVFAIEAIGVIMPLENNMKTPQNFVGICGVLNRGMSSVTLVYILLGFLGYLKYGNTADAVITSNLPITEIPAQIVKVLIGLAVFFTFGLQFYVCIDIAWTGLKDYFPNRPRLAQYVVRTVMVIACVCLAIAIPNIGPLVELVGAFCFSLLGLLAPVVIEVITYWDVGFGRFNWMIIKNIIVTFIGVLALVFGTNSAIQGIIKAML